MEHNVDYTIHSLTDVAYCNFNVHLLILGTFGTDRVCYCAGLGPQLIHQYSCVGTRLLISVKANAGTAEMEVQEQIGWLVRV